MNKMEFSRSRIIKIAVMLVFLSCVLFANFIAVRMMLRYGVETYFYDKLLVAYSIGGVKGVRMELEMIPLTDKSPGESMLAKDFSARFGTLSDPEAFLKDKVQKGKKMVYFIRNMRSAALALMLIILGWQLVVKFSGRSRPKIC